jgi:hypothetical protein
MKSFASALFLLPVLLFATEHYLFPDQGSDASHTLKQKILRTEKKLVLISSALHDKTLVNAVEKILQGGRHVTFVTASERQASYFAKYRNIDVRVMKMSTADSTQTLNLDYMLLDDGELCLSTLPFDVDMMRNSTGTMQCTVEAESVRFYRRVTEALMARSARYLD